MIFAPQRFRRRVIITLGVIVALLAVSVGVVIALARAGDSLVRFAPAVMLVAVIVTLLAVNLPAFRNELALRRIHRGHPHALVFLAWRQPSLAPDLPSFLRRKNLSVQVKDSWVPAVVDESGISAWSTARHPHQLLLMEWSELGEIVATDFIDVHGRTRFGISVDVRPFPTPLVVVVGSAWLGVQGAFNREQTQAVADAANARRPVSP